MKCEPSAYTIEDLQRDGTTGWEGVRNYQVRNFLRDDVQVGDDVLFYASNADPSGVTGLARVVRAGYPDPFAMKKGHAYYDSKSTIDNPIWFSVDIAFVERFLAPVPLQLLKRTKGLEKMLVNQKGNRLSVQPCTSREFEIVCRLGRQAFTDGVGAPLKANTARRLVRR
jgi:predicted RNA-binding protein with PUA-like domain